MFNFKRKNIVEVKDAGYFIEHENGISRTIGLPGKYGVLNIEFKNEGLVSDTIAEEIIINSVKYETSKGFEFNTPSVYIIDKYGCYTWYIVTKHNDEFVYRIIVPDGNNKAPWNPGCDPKFKSQFTSEDFNFNKEYKNFLYAREVLA